MALQRDLTQDLDVLACSPSCLPVSIQQSFSVPSCGGGIEEVTGLAIAPQGVNAHFVFGRSRDFHLRFDTTVILSNIFSVALHNYFLNYLGEFCTHKKLLS